MGPQSRGLFLALPLCIRLESIYQAFPAACTVWAITACNPHPDVMHLDMCATPRMTQAFQRKGYSGKMASFLCSLQASTVSFQPAMTGYGHMELWLCLRVFSHDVFSFPTMWIGTVGIEGRRVNESDDKGWGSAWQFLQKKKYILGKKYIYKIEIYLFIYKI